jgi:general secretion pathway protein E/type IV pilus assembly protein PilB
MQPLAYTLSTELQQLLSTELAWEYAVLPLELSNGSLTLLSDEHASSAGVAEELELILGKKVKLQPATSAFIRENLSKYYMRNSNAAGKSAKVNVIAAKQGDEFLPMLIAEARQLGSSDIHIETFAERARVRVRIDGQLVERYVIAKNDYPALINKIKIKANLDIAEKRLPQDGRIFFQQGEMKFDIRVSVLPTMYGEKAVLRLLSNDATNIDIRKLGFSERQLTDYLDGVKNPHGILLISGPTGSGKTTTLYATLKMLNKETTNVLTVEDPVEYTLEGINQVQLKESIGLGFASALRTFLRQDPDIIMLGEIRDGETAQMAVRAALTGHLVLSTIHTNSAWGTISRLSDMGVPPFLIANTLNTSVAQRLVRLLCRHCAARESFSSAMIPRNFRGTHTLSSVAVPVGCPECYYTGYKGRKAIYEVVPVDAELADCIRNGNGNPAELYAERKIATLADSAFAMLQNGETSCEEVYSILAHAVN